MEDSERPGFFKDYYESVRKSVSKEQMDQFLALKTDQDKVRFVFESIPAIHEIELKSAVKGKSEKEAIENKEAGNKEFGKKRNEEALKCYSQAVVRAPVLSGKYWKLIKENADPKKMTLYPICLANRSAALYHIKDHYHCVRDIDEALEHHYPKELKWKLYKRKARILIELRRHLDARDAFRQALKWMDWAKLERDRLNDIKKEIQKWLHLFEAGSCVRNLGEFKEKAMPPLPELTGGSNPTLSALSSKIKVEYSPTRGRQAIAAEDIAVGEYLVTEEAYAAVLLKETFATHCQNCFCLVTAPIPCKRCSGVVFCSSDCRQSAYFHRVECQVQDLLQGSGMSINCFLSLRMVTQTPLEFFSNNKDKLDLEENPEVILPLIKEQPILEDSEPEEEEEVVDKDKPKEDRQIKDFKNCSEAEKERLIKEDEEIREKRLKKKEKADEREYARSRRKIEEAKSRKELLQKWKEEAFWRVYHLVRHSGDRSAVDFFHRCVMVCFMVKTLQKTCYFDSVKPVGMEGKTPKLSPEEQMVGGLLLRFLQIVQFNAHEVSEFSITAENIVENAENKSVGAAIYPTLAYFNHSCHGAQVRYFSGTTVITRAIRPIKKGELVPENYGMSYANKTRTERQAQLRDRYWFECQCEACTENWPKFDDMDQSKLKFRCQKCTGPLLVPLDNPNPFYKCNNCGEQTNILGACKNLSNSDKTYEAALAELKNANVAEGERLLEENLGQLWSALCPPYRDYHLTQESYTKCCLLKGNKRVQGEKPAKQV